MDSYRTCWYGLLRESRAALAWHVGEVERSYEEEAVVPSPAPTELPHYSRTRVDPPSSPTAHPLPIEGQGT